MVAAEDALASRGDIVALTPVIQRVIGARVRDPETVDDLTQETLVRMLAARDRLGAEAVAPYAIVTARNLVTSHGRTEDRRRRHRHRLLDLRQPSSPEDQALRSEERVALSAALAALSPRDRATVLAHELGDVDTATLAGEEGISSAAVAVRLARLRAKLRVEYLLALHRVELPTAACKRILLALSAGDRRRQHALRAGSHLLQCATCAELSQPLLQRGRRAAAAFVPVGLVSLWDWLRQSARQRPLQSVTATAAVAAVIAAVVVAAGGRDVAEPPPRPEVSEPIPRNTGPLVLDRPTFAQLTDPQTLARYTDRLVQADDVLVQAVAADEGFWVASDDETYRLWVQLSGDPESPQTIRAGDQVSFTGTIKSHGDDFPRQVGVTTGEGAEELLRLGHHIAVPVDDLTLG